MKTTTKVPAEAEDHRVRVGAARRNKTRLLLLESALGVLHAKGPDSAVIEDFIAAAGVSRGTFYNYFDTTSELYLALATEMSDEILGVVDPVVLGCSNPIERFSTGTRLYMQVATRYPLWGSFLNRVGTRIATRGQLIEKYLTRDLSDALAQGLIEVDNVLVARDLVLGSIYYGIETMVSEPTHADHPEHLVYAILRGLRVPEQKARAVAFSPLQKIEAIDGPIFSRLKQGTPKLLTAKTSRKNAVSSVTDKRKADSSQ